LTSAYPVIRKWYNLKLACNIGSPRVLLILIDMNITAEAASNV